MQESNSSVSHQPKPPPPPAICVVELIAIDNLRLDGGTQTRASLNQGGVKDYAELMKTSSGAAMPPVVVFRDEANQCWLADGFHRVAAAQRINRTEVEAEIRLGSRLDALKHSLGANLLHGVRRTNADKRRSVEIVLAEKAFRGQGDNSLADLCGVSNHLVAEVRRELEKRGGPQVGDFPTSNGLVKRRGKDNKLHPTSKKQRQKPAADVQPALKPTVTDDQAGVAETEGADGAHETATVNDSPAGEPISPAMAGDEDQPQIRPPDGEDQKHGASSSSTNTDAVAEAAPCSPTASQTGDHHPVDDARWDDGVFTAEEIRGRLELIPKTHRCPSSAEQEALQDCFLEITRTINRLAETVCVARSVRTEIVLDAAKIVSSLISTRRKPDKDNQ